MTTKRTPKNYGMRAKISPLAIDTFREMLKLESRCKCRPNDMGSHGEHRTCRFCEQWWKLNAILVDELRLFPGDWPSYQRATVFPAAAEGFEPTVESQQRYRALCEAAGIEATP